MTDPPLPPSPPARPQLPTALVNFLASYPHPCCALRASPLHAALTTRHPVGDSNNVAHQDTGLCPPTATLAPPTSTRHSTTSSAGGAPPSSTGTSKNADAILSQAFGEDPQSTPPASALPRNHSRLLEGGSQQAHHPSRTAEGAVAAMYEQQAARNVKGVKDRAEAATSNDDKRVHREEDEEVARHVGANQWGGVGRNMDEGAEGNRGREGMGRSLDDLLTPEWANDKWVQLLQTKEVKSKGKGKECKKGGEGEEPTPPLAPPPPPPKITLMTLLSRDDLQKVLALLVQVIAPAEGSSSSARSDNTITLSLTFPRHSANYRSSRRRQRLGVPTRASRSSPHPDIKANAYNSTASHSVSSGSVSSSSSGGLHMENTYNLQLVATWMEEEDLIVVTSLATNIFPNVSTSSKSKQPSTSDDSVTASRTVPHRPALTHSQPAHNTLRPSPRGADPSPSPRSSTPLAPISEVSSTSSPSASSSSRSTTTSQAPARPPLLSRDSGMSGASNSSSITVQPYSSSFSSSGAPTPTPSHPGTRANSHELGVFPSPPSIAEVPPPLPTDGTPEPMPTYTGKPTYNDRDAERAAALLLGDQADVVDPNKAFLLEKRKRRRVARKEEREREKMAGVVESGVGGKAGEDRELTLEEEKREGVWARERAERRWKVEMDRRDGEGGSGSGEEDGEDEEEREDLDERIDRELDGLRVGSDLESGAEEEVKGEGLKSMCAAAAAPEGDERERTDDDEGSDSDSDDDDDDEKVPPPLSTAVAALSSSPGGHLPSPLSSENLHAQQHDSNYALHSPASINTFLEIISRTPTGRLIAAHDWSKTKLGEIRVWAPELRSMVMLCLASPFRASLWWGEDSTLIYNDEYARLLAEKHPGMLGLAGAIGWAELWDSIGPLAARVMQGETVSFFDHHLPMIFDGETRETYHSWSFVPFRDRAGQVVGYENTSFETTGRVIAERRLATMRELAQISQMSRTSMDYYQKILQIIAKNSLDLPFALLYSCETVNPNLGKRTAGSASDPQTGSSSRQDQNANTASIKLTLQGTVGVPDGHLSAPNELVTRIDATPPSFHDASETSSTTSNTGTGTGSASATNSSQTTGTDGATSWPFQEACSSRKPVFISDLAGRAKGFQQRGWPSEVKHAVVIPIVLEGDTTSIPRACLILGLNPRRPWNEIFATFLNLLARNVSMGLLNVTMAETQARRTEELVQLDRAKTTWVANVSHELRTPLTLILGPIDDVLGTKSLPAEDREKLVIVQRHGQRLLNMVNTLLDFSRLEAGKMEAVYRPVKLGPMVADLASLFRAAIERGSIDLVVECQPEPKEGAPVYLATELFEKVIFNLLGNAFKYTLKGSITVKVNYESSKAIVQIIDTGCGIADHELSLIFDRFHRVEGTSRSIGGTGIGLALTLELVKTLGGTLTVESALNKGSTFAVTFPRGSSHLPAAQVDDQPADLVDLPPRAQNSLSIIEDAANWKLEPSPPVDGAASPANSPATGAPVSLAPIATSLAARTPGAGGADDPFTLSADLLDLRDSTILLVDDNADLRQYIGNLLGKAFNVVQLEDGQAALEYCIATPPSLVVSDVMMPRLDGMGLLKALRSNPTTALIPIIFLSAQAGPEARVEALLSGVDDYLIKPFQGKELLARVNIHLQLGKMRIELERRVEERTRALIESEMRYRGLADRYSTLSLLSPVGIFMADAQGKVNYANPQFYSISGCDAEGTLFDWRSQIMDEYQDAVEDVWREAINPSSSDARPVAATSEFRWKVKQNWVLLEIRPFSENGVHRGFVGSITDIDRIKEAEELHVRTVEARRIEAEDHRRQSEQFLDLTSHELRNPLSGVWQNAQVVGESLDKYIDLLEDLQDGDVPDEETVDSLLAEMHENVEALDSILTCAAHQQRIADDILNVSKLNMGLLSIQVVPFELESKVQEVVTMFMVECQQKAIKLTLRKGESIRALDAERIIADPGRLNQCLINFVTNGVKYTTESQRRAITIHLDAFTSPPPQPEQAMRVSNKTAAIEGPPEPDTIWIQVGVEDSGKGLTQDELKKLFARFSQANPKSDQYGGSGLGLYVSKKLVELHRGFIEVESVPGQGSTFRFTIPANRASSSGDQGDLLALPPTLAAGGARRAKSSRPGSSTGRSASIALTTPVATPALDDAANEAAPLHVLVIEDNIINQKVLMRQLKLAGHTVSVAGNGREGLDVLLAEADKEHNTSPITVVLMDIEMPVMGGLEAIKLLREMETSGEIKKRYPVIAVTGNARQAQLDLCLEAGFDSTTVKPYNIKGLLSLIQRAAKGQLRE